MTYGFTHVAGRRIEGAAGTWIDPEELAYPRGTLRHSRRRGRVRCADGRLRTIRLGVADSASTIPARGQAYGRTLSGHVECHEGVFTFFRR